MTDLSSNQSAPTDPSDLMISKGAIASNRKHLVILMAGPAQHLGDDIMTDARCHDNTRPGTRGCNTWMSQNTGHSY